LSSHMGAGPAAAEPGALYTALVCETPSVVGPLQTLISVAPALVGQVVSIDVRPGIAAVLHHEERQSAATAAAGLAGAMRRSAAPKPLAPYPRLLLHVVQRSGDGRRAQAAAGFEHALHEEGKWAGVCARGGSTIALGDTLNEWRLQLSWVGGVPPLDVLSSYAIFLGRPGHPAAVPAMGSAAAETAAAAKALVLAALPASHGRTRAPCEACAASPAAVLFSLSFAGSGDVRAMPAMPQTNAGGEELVGGTRVSAAIGRPATASFDVEYMEHRPGRMTQLFRRHTRQDARCPLCHLDGVSVRGLLEHFHALHTDVNVEFFRAVSAADLGGAASSRGGSSGWDRYLANVRWLSTPMLLPGIFGLTGCVTPSGGAVQPSARLRPIRDAISSADAHPAGCAASSPQRRVDEGAVRPVGGLRDRGGPGSATATAAFLRGTRSSVCHPLAPGACRRRPRMSLRSSGKRAANRTLASASAGRKYFHTGTLASLTIKQCPHAELSSDSEDDVNEDWLHSMDAARLEALELPAHDVLFMSLWTGYVDAVPSWGDRGAAFLLGSFLVARRRTILETGLLAQAVAHVEVMYTHRLLDVDAAAQAIGVLTDRSSSCVPRGSFVGAANGQDPAEAVIATAAGVAASDARAAAAKPAGKGDRQAKQ